MAERQRTTGQRIDIVVRRFTCSPQDARRGLMRIFKLDSDSARRFVQAVPALAKRGASPAAARRYTAALRSIGAEVECLDASSGAPVVFDGPSLPAPSSSMAPAVRESMRVERATQDAVERFRAEEARAASVRPWGQDHDPRIPQAPALPHDLGRMRNARSQASDRPASDQAPAAGLPAHVDAQLPPPRTSLGTAAEPPAGVGVTLHTTDRPERLGVTPAAGRSTAPPPRTFGWPLLLAVVAAAVAIGYGLWLSGIFSDPADERRERWAMAGIEGGQHAPLPDWLDRPEREVAGMGQAELRALVGKLRRAGAKRVWAIRIAENERAEAMLVELPSEPEARRTVFWQAARATGVKRSLLEDRGQRFHELLLSP